MEQYKKDFINFLIEKGAFRTGEFTLKSGRISPYFINTGMFDDGDSISKLGFFYASRLMDENIPDIDIIFGPAYKGIPLAVSTASALSRDFGKNAGYSFDRKEAKEHGDEASAGKKIIVGKEIRDGSRIILIDDVFTTGETKYETLALLNSLAKDLKYPALIIAVDRMESNERGTSNIAEFNEKTGIPVISIVNIREIISYLDNSGKLSAEDKGRFEKYLEEYSLR